MTSIFDRPEFNAALFFPRRDRSAPPAGARDLRVNVGGGVHVHVRRHAAPDARCTLLLFHGNGEVVADYDDAAARYARCGAALSIADYRGYGASDGTPTLRAVIEDARPIAEAVAAEAPGPLVVMGRSLGGAAAHELYARPIATMVGVVLESTFVDMPALIRRRGLTPPPLTAEEEAVFDPRTKLPLGQLPLLVLHGDRDQIIVPTEGAATLAAAGSADKRLVMIAGRGHNDISFADTYWGALADFIARLQRSVAS
ncbi:MAG: alpha/beta fold hydrolase [Deltaproteobacteria bacterium]|nr:alpha/beta fold hydrolase [Deltaproteobacteria bacterium]MDQ3300958.1 lysophospholipase [Myxococcota bacterium]